MTLLASLRQMLSISQEMQAQAIAGQWEALPSLQARRQTLMAAQPIAASQATAVEQHEIRRLLAEIQACDTAIYDHVLPLRDQLAAWLPATPAQP